MFQARQWSHSARLNPTKAPYISSAIKLAIGFRWYSSQYIHTSNHKHSSKRNHMKKRLSASLALLFAVSLSGQAIAQDSATDVSKATGDSAVASAKLTAAGVKAVVGVVALPVIAVGSTAESAGHVTSESGQAVWAAANAPLEVSPETVVAQPVPAVPYNAQGVQPSKKTDAQK